jgi:hypothetical protein
VVGCIEDPDVIECILNHLNQNSALDQVLAHVEPRSIAGIGALSALYSRPFLRSIRQQPAVYQLPTILGVTDANQALRCTTRRHLITKI